MALTLGRTTPSLLHGRHFDVLVVGGGIHGAAIAREATLAGASTLLVERDDFACGTSSRSSRLIHGGVRYLQQGHLALVREALQERERLLRLAPHLVRPLPVLMPFFQDGGKPGWQLRIGLWLYDKLARGSTLPKPVSHRPAECLRLFPGLRVDGLKGGVLYFDAATNDARVVLAVLEAAVRAGAVVANHTEVTGTDREAVVLRDRLTGDDVHVRAAHVINAAGVAVDRVRRLLGIDGPAVARASRGSHLVLDPIDCETSLAAFLSDGRIQFVVPHTDATLCGTTDVDEEPQGDPSVPMADVEYLLAALAQLLARPPGRQDIRFGYSGWRSLPAVKGPPGALHREGFLVDERSVVGEVHTVVGGKLTTHRSFAERCVGRVFGRDWVSPSREQPLPGGEGPRQVQDPLWSRYGSLSGAVRSLADREPALLEPICPHRPFLRAEALYAVRHRAAITLTDLAVRRLIDSRGPCLEPACLAALGDLWAREATHPGPLDKGVADVRSVVLTTAGAALD